MLFARVAIPRALEDLVRDIRLAANVRTRTTVVLQTFYEHRPIVPRGAAGRRRPQYIPRWMPRHAPSRSVEACSARSPARS
jgi:hypothetical protein